MSAEYERCVERDLKELRSRIYVKTQDHIQTDPTYITETVKLYMALFHIIMMNSMYSIPSNIVTNWKIDIDTLIEYHERTIKTSHASHIKHRLAYMLAHLFVLDENEYPSYRDAFEKVVTDDTHSFLSRLNFLEDADCTKRHYIDFIDLIYECLHFIPKHPLYHQKQARRPSLSQRKSSQNHSWRHHLQSYIKEKSQEKDQPTDAKWMYLQELLLHFITIYTHQLIRTDKLCGTFGCIVELEQLFDQRFNYIVYEPSNAIEPKPLDIGRIKRLYANPTYVVKVYKTMDDNMLRQSIQNELHGSALLGEYSSNNDIEHKIIYIKNMDTKFSIYAYTSDTIVCSIMKRCSHDLNDAYPTLIHQVDKLHTLCSDILGSVGRLHSMGYVHNDIKDLNILYCPTNEKHPFQLIDFDFLRRIHSNEYSAAGTIFHPIILHAANVTNQVTRNAVETSMKSIERFIATMVNYYQDKPIEYLCAIHVVEQLKEILYDTASRASFVQRLPQLIDEYALANVLMNTLYLHIDVNINNIKRIDDYKRMQVNDKRVKILGDYAMKLLDQHICICRDFYDAFTSKDGSMSDYDFLEWYSTQGQKRYTYRDTYRGGVKNKKTRWMKCKEACMARSCLND
jgi:tRNA A-37 threonylcarbamoyl transferase component Bud32